MTKGELIVACIKVMFDNDTEMLDPETISDNPEYQSRTANIIESINRGFDEIAKNRKLPKKTFVLDNDIGDKGDYYTRYNLNALIEEKDVLYISHIAYENAYDYNPNVEVRLEGENILVLPNIKHGKYIVNYYPKYTKHLSYDDPDTKEIEDIPGEALRVLPYFVKAELYEDDDPEKAVLARNIFHQYLRSIPETPLYQQHRVKSVFRGW